MPKEPKPDLKNHPKLLPCGHSGPAWCGHDPRETCPHEVKGKKPCKNK